MTKLKKTLTVALNKSIYVRSRLYSTRSCRSRGPFSFGATNVPHPTFKDAASMPNPLKQISFLDRVDKNPELRDFTEALRLYDAQLKVFGSFWAPDTIEYMNAGGCIEARPKTPSNSWTSNPIPTLPLLASTRDNLVSGFNHQWLTPFQWSTFSCYLGRRDLLLYGFPGAGKSFGSIIILIELVTRRLLEIMRTQAWIAQTNDVKQRTFPDSAEKSEALTSREYRLRSEQSMSGTSSNPTSSTSVTPGTPAMSTRLVAVVVCPTWEAVHWMAQTCARLLRNHPLKLRCGFVAGSQTIPREVEKLRDADRPHILFGTLGRLLEHIQHTKGFRNKLRQANFLIVDEATAVLSAGSVMDGFRWLRQQLHESHQTILHTSTIDETLKRSAFRMLKTNFLYVNTVECSSESEKFPFMEWLKDYEKDTSRYVAEMAMEFTDDIDQQSDKPWKQVHSHCVAAVSSVRDSDVSVSEGILAPEKPPRLSPTLLAGFLNQEARENERFLQLSSLDNIGSGNEECPRSRLENQTVDHPVTEGTKLVEPRVLNNGPITATSQKKASEPYDTEGGSPCVSGSIWLTRCTENALKSAVSPLPRTVRVFIHVYDPRQFAMELYNCIEMELHQQLIDTESDTAIDVAKLKENEYEQGVAMPLTSSRPSSKILVIFPTVKAVRFYALLFGKYMNVGSTRSACVLTCHSDCSGEERHASLQLFNRGFKNVILFATGMVAPLIDCATSLIHVGSTEEARDFVHMTRVLNPFQSSLPHRDISEIDASRKKRIVVFVSPLELGYLENLLQLRIPLRELPPVYKRQLTRPLPTSVAEALQPFPRTLAETEDALVPMDFQAVAKLQNNPAAFAWDPYGRLTNCGAANTVEGDTSRSVISRRWLEDPQALALCQAMYRSLLGYYCYRDRELKINRMAIPKFLNDHLHSAGLTRFPPVSRPFAARLRLHQCPDLYISPVALPKLEVLGTIGVFGDG